MNRKKTYKMPYTGVVTIYHETALLTVSGQPETMSVHDIGATEESVMLSRNSHSLWDDDEEE